MYYDLKGDKFCPVYDEMSPEEIKNRLLELEGAEPNKIDTIKVNSVEQPIVDKTVDLEISGGDGFKRIHENYNAFDPFSDTNFSSSLEVTQE